MTEPSVLEYVRHFDLTTDYRADDLSRYIHQFQSLKRVQSESDDGFERISQSLISTAEKHAFKIDDGTEQAPDGVTDYLKEAATFNKPEFGNLLPDHRRSQKLKLRIPLLCIGNGDVARDVRKIRRGINLEQALDDVLEDHEHAERLVCRRKKQSNTVTTDDIQSIVYQNLREAAQLLPMEASSLVVKYLTEALQKSLHYEQRSPRIEHHMPKRNGILRSQPLNLTETDVDVGHEHQQEGCPLSNVSPCIEQLEGDAVVVNAEDGRLLTDRDLLTYLDHAIDEEIILSGQNSETVTPDSPVTALSGPRNTELSSATVTQESTEAPSYKRRKLTHDFTPLLIAQAHTYSTTITSPISASEALHFKIPMIQLDSVIKKGPLIDVQNMAELYFRPDPSQQAATPGLDKVALRFLTYPSICEIFKVQMPSDTSIMEKFLGKPKKVLTSAQILWKQPGIRLLDRQEDDCNDLSEVDYSIEDELDDEKGPLCSSSHFSNTSQNHVQSHPERCSIPSETFETGVIDSKQQPKIKPFRFSMKDLHCLSRNVRNNANSSKLRALSIPLKHHVGSPLRQTTLLFDESLQVDASSDSLANFMELRGKQFKLPIKEVFIDKMELDSDPIQFSQVSANHNKTSCVKAAEQSTGPDTMQQPDIPGIEPCQQLTIVFLNSSLLQHKPLLIQFLENQINGSLNLIYRDLNTGSTNGPDLILSANACLFVVSLQLLSQRPLPGQQGKTGLSPAHDNILCALDRYDHILVLVHYVPTGEADTYTRLQTSQSEFASFCFNLTRHNNGGDISIIPIWLPCIKASSTSDVVNAWIWRLIRQQGYSPFTTTGSPKGTLIDDVTLWELLLVKTGLNPMAAQIVIGLLKSTSAVAQSETGMDVDWGLRRLMKMSEEERHEMFDTTIGQRAVKRLCEAVSR